MHFTKTSAAAVIAFAASAQAQSGAWAQCGGNGFSGSTSCISGYTCQYSSEWYSQCVPGSGGGTGATTTKSASTTRTSSQSTIRTSTTRTTTAGTTQPTSGGGGSSSGSPIGYGAGTTGGGSGSGTTVTSCSALSSAAGKGGVVYVSGILSGCGIISVASSTSIIGVGTNSGMTGGGLKARGASNIIIKNLKMYNAVSGGDLLAFDTTTKVWIDHCDLYNGGLVGGKDDKDGLLDITHACDYITVSWTKFHDHWKGSLIGHSDSNGSEDTGKFRVTYHNNWWNNVNSRLPSNRFGTVHIFNSCFANSPTSGINSRMGAVTVAENNSFTDVKLALVTDLDSSTEGSINSSGNLFLGTTTTRITKTNSFKPPYSYSLESASSVCSTTSSGAGPK